MLWASSVLVWPTEGLGQGLKWCPETGPFQVPLNCSSSERERERESVGDSSRRQWRRRRPLRRRGEWRRRRWISWRKARAHRHVTGRPNSTANLAPGGERQTTTEAWTASAASPTRSSVRSSPSSPPRTALASRWRHLWLSAPVNLDHTTLPADGDAQAGIISRILAAHPGPARRLAVPVSHLRHRPAAVDAWLRSPALDNLRELEVDDCWQPTWSPLPASAFRSSATLRVLTVSSCHIRDGEVEMLQFPQLRMLGLVGVRISETSLHSFIAACPVLECLLLKGIYRGIPRIRINSPSLISVRVHSDAKEVIIEDAPSLQRLLPEEANRYVGSLLITVISAPKLETLGGLSDDYYSNKFVFGTTVIQGLCAVTFTSVVHSVKVLAVSNYKLNLDTVINLMRCFPSLEKLYIWTSKDLSGGKNLWRRKQGDLTRCLDIRLKKIVMQNYRGIKSQVNFAKFFIFNAKILELMRFEGAADRDSGITEIFIAEQHRLLQLEKRASRNAQFCFRTSRCHQPGRQIKNVHDLSKADPFE